MPVRLSAQAALFALAVIALRASASAQDVEQGAGPPDAAVAPVVDDAAAPDAAVAPGVEDAAQAGEPSLEAPEPAADGTAPLSDPEAYLADLGADSFEEEPSYPRLSLYGFADFMFSKFFMPQDNLIALYTPTRSTFSVGNLNVYIDSQMSRRARSLIEVRFSFLPNGVTTLDPLTARVTRTSTEVPDYRILGRNSQWGTIAIERVVLSYEIMPWLTLTVGRFITPWGIWNIDHGTPSLISLISPLFVDGQYIPTRQTGIQVSGERTWTSLRAGYYLTLSNGRGPVETYRDFDENKAFGGRLYLSLLQRGELTLGFTLYLGRETTPISQYVQIAPDGSRAYIATKHEASSFEKALGGDLKWEYKGALIMGEFVASGRTYDDDHRGLVDEAQGSLVSDGRRQIASDTLRFGGYILAGYRFRFLGTMPFANIEYNRDGASFLAPKYFAPQLGLNIRPEPGLVLKLIGSRAVFIDAEERFFGKSPTIYTFHTQVAWAF